MPSCRAELVDWQAERREVGQGGTRASVELVELNLVLTPASRDVHLIPGIAESSQLKRRGMGERQPSRSGAQT